MSRWFAPGLAVLGGCVPEPSAVEPTPSLGAAEHVVVLVLDGVRIEESFGSGTSSAADGVPTSELLPRVRAELVPEGTLVLPAYNLGTTTTAPGHAVLLTGAPVAFGNFPPTESSGAYFPALPTLFELVRSQYDAPASHVALTGNTTLLDGLGRSTYPGLGAGFGTEYVSAEGDRDGVLDEDVVAAVRELLDTSPSRLLVANLHIADHMGHRGELASDYATAVRAQDEPIAELWAWIQSDDRLRDTTTLVLVGDHGRHRLGYDEDYREHGDSCAGCREVPMLLLGAGVPRGVVVDGGAALEDLSATVAWLLGLDDPYTTGRVLVDGGGGPAGLVLPVATDLVTVAQLHLDDDARSAVVLGGAPAGEAVVLDEVLSTPGAYAAERPVVASANGVSVACWRELSTLGGEDLPWVPRCVRLSGGERVPLPAPLSAVNPSFEPALALGPGATPWLAVADNLSGAVDAQEENRAVRLLVYDGARWVGGDQGLVGVVYPTAPALAPDGDQALVAFAASAEVSTGREDRHVELHRVDEVGGAQAWTPLYDSLGLATGVRHDLPAVGLHDGELSLAYLDIDDEGVSVVVTRSTDGGHTWTTPARLDEGGRVFSHLAPQVWDGRVAWTQLGADEAELCLEGEEPSCAPLGALELGGFARAGDEVLVSTRVDGAWVVRVWAGAG